MRRGGLLFPSGTTVSDRSAHGPRAAGGSLSRGSSSHGWIPSPHALPLSQAAARPASPAGPEAGTVPAWCHAPAPVPQGMLEDVMGVSAERLGDRSAFVQQIR